MWVYSFFFSVLTAAAVGKAPQSTVNMALVLAGGLALFNINHLVHKLKGIPTSRLGN